MLRSLMFSRQPMKLNQEDIQTLNITSNRNCYLLFHYNNPWPITTSLNFVTHEEVIASEAAVVFPECYSTNWWHQNEIFQSIIGRKIFSVSAGTNIDHHYKTTQNKRINIDFLKVLCIWHTLVCLQWGNYHTLSTPMTFNTLYSSNYKLWLLEYKLLNNLTTNNFVKQLNSFSRKRSQVSAIWRVLPISEDGSKDCMQSYNLFAVDQGGRLERNWGEVEIKWQVFEKQRQWGK